MSHPQNDKYNEAMYEKVMIMGKFYKTKKDLPKGEAILEGLKDNEVVIDVEGGWLVIKRSIIEEVEEIPMFKGTRENLNNLELLKKYENI